MNGSTHAREPGHAAPDHSAEAENLAGLYAFGVLDGAELARFERHLTACARCGDVVAGDNVAVMTLGLTVPEAEPSPDLKARLLDRARASLAHGGSNGPATGEAAAPSILTHAATRRRRASLAWILPLAAITLLLLGGAAILQREVASAQIVASAPLENRRGKGQAQVVIRRSGEAVIQLQGFDDLGNGQVYQAWVIRPNSQPVATGAGTRGDGALRLEGDVRGATVAVTVEPGPGAQAPSTQPFLLGQLPS